MKVKVNHNTLRKILEIAYERRKAVFIEGLAGIGKSSLVKEVSKELAKKYGKEFVDLAEIDVNSIKEEEYHRYWFFVDVRLSIYDSTDIKGIPLMSNNKEYIEWKLPKEFYILCKEGVYGTLFLDELNQASHLVQKASFQLILDRKINSRKISDNVLVVGAGNRLTEDYVERMPRQLINRFIYLELRPPSTEEWVQWAVNNSIDERVIGFVMWKNKIYEYIESDEQENYMTPRSLHFLSDLIKGIDDLEVIESIAVGTLGSSNGIEFVNFVKVGSMVESIYKDIGLIDKYSEEKRYDILYAFIVNLFSNVKKDFNKYSGFVEKTLNSKMPKDLKYALVRLLLSDNEISNDVLDYLIKVMKTNEEIRETIRKITKHLTTNVKL